MVCLEAGGLVKSERIGSGERLKGGRRGEGRERKK